jgi:hypothetical protein
VFAFLANSGKADHSQSRVMILKTVALSCLLVALIAAASVAQADEQVEETAVRHAIEAVLDMDPGRQTNRLPRVTLDPSRGDLTVVFAMRRPLSDDPAQIVASATDDVFTILWATYTSVDAPRIRTTTVLGTYAVVGRYENPKEVPLLRAVLSADRAANFDWADTATLDPSQALDVWWVERELMAAGPIAH